MRHALPSRVRARWLVLFAATAIAALAGIAAGRFARLDMPNLVRLEDYAPSEMTRVLARDGSEIAVFAAEKRILVDPADIPTSFRDALIASEDSRFESHPGIDLVGGLRALWSDLRQRRIDQGASTLTMQLAGNLFLDRSQRTVSRKVQEAFLAFEIERRFSKREILGMYCNQVHFGHGLYGLEAAARFFFDKPARHLTLGESATLVGLLPRPASYSPLRNPKRSTERRDLVLRRMVDEGRLSAAEAERVRGEPIVLARRRDPSELAPHFGEGVRRRLQERFGSSDLYRGGLVVRTTLDPQLQRIANRAVEVGLRDLDKRQGWRGDSLRRVPGGEKPEAWVSEEWTGAPETGAITEGVVLAVDADTARIRIGSATTLLDAEGISWTGQNRPDRLLSRGDIVRVRVLERTDDGVLRTALEQEPEVEAALVAIDPASGEILAWVGGFDFARSQYDHAGQARRQPGSLFKPFVYTAALERGWTLSDSLLDEPTVFLDRSKPVPYQPENFSRRYYGSITLRTALEKSINIATVKLLHRVGYDAVIDVARRSGVKSRLRPYPSLALGSFELTLLEVTSAYGVFANRGLHFEPTRILGIEDREGRSIHQASPGVQEAMSPQIAYLMSQALSGVVRRGTARSVSAALPGAWAGKTGTTDDNSDAWFVGYSPHLVVGVWVGYDDPRSLGLRETGGAAALPIWAEIMEHVPSRFREEEFAEPDGIVRVAIDAATGKLPRFDADCEERIREVFVAGTEPIESCSIPEHERLALPHSFQRYELEPDGALAIPPGDLYRLLETEPDARLKRGRKLLILPHDDGDRRVRLRLLRDEQPVFTRESAGVEPESRYGVDGRRARIVWFGPPQGPP